METILAKIDRTNIDQSIIEKAGEILKSGGLVAFPTETVYGLGADALNEKAAEKTYAAKGRPSDNPLIVHIAEDAALEKIVSEIPKGTKELIAKFWPGPLTLIFNKSDAVPYGTTGGLETVAVRMPSDEIAREVIVAAGGYVSAPSANTSGRPSPTTAAHVAEDLSGKIEMIIDGGSASIGVESSILDMTVTPPMILRPGAITKEMFEAVIGEIAVDQTILNAESKQAPKAPGMKYRHYAPKAQLTIVDADVSGMSADSKMKESMESAALEQVIQAIQKLTKDAMAEGKKVGIIATSESISAYSQGVVKNIGSREVKGDVAKHLYKVLREFDEEEVDLIYSEPFTTKGIGKAVMNRLEKAAGHHHISTKDI